MSEEEIKAKKLEELKQKYHNQIESQIHEEAQMSQQIDALESMVKTKLTKEALQRYGNIKAAHPDKAIQVLMMLAQLMQTGKVQTVDDEQLKRMLVMMNQRKKEIKITRK
ncbi:DNA-binding protein [Thermoproteota archaeon]